MVSHFTFFPFYRFPILPFPFLPFPLLPFTVLTEPVLMPTASAISCTLTRRFCYTVFSTARQFSLQTASDGRPDRGSSSRLLLPWRNSAAQRLTVAYEGAHSPYTTVIRLCICCGGTFSSVRNSITARYNPRARPNLTTKLVNRSNHDFWLAWCLRYSKNGLGRFGSAA